jgi:ABC-type transport system involved in multi-copper enzyme maturation permease subunit
MPSSASLAVGRFHRVFSWTAVKHSWTEIAAGLLFAVGAGFAWWFDNRLALSQKIFVWVPLLVALAFLSRRGWFRLFGPVLFYDLIRVARRSRYISLRCVYAVALLLVLYWQYVDLMTNRRPAPRVLLLTQKGSAWTAQSQTNLMAEFAERYFNIFMVLQFSIVVLLTPIYAASSIAEEKERKTLEYLLATDLSNREIVLSKMVSRLANLSLTLMTGLPILSLVQFMGGVDPDLVLAGFAATIATMVSLGALSTLLSVYARRPRDAILFTYLGLAGYMGFGALIYPIRSSPAWSTATLTYGSLTLGDLEEGFNAGNLPLVLYDLHSAWSRGTSLAGLIAGLLKGYLIFHLAIAAIFAAWAVLRLRFIALTQTTEKRKSAALRRRPRIRPRLALKPMVWKEVFVEPGFRLHWMGWAVVGLLVLISLLPAFWIGARYLSGQVTSSGRSGFSGFLVTSASDLNFWMRTTGSIVACLLLLAVAARASTSISGERDRETLDALLASPLQSHDIIFGKWLGSLLSVRWGWLWLWLIWGMAMAGGAMEPLAIPLFMITWLVYASCFAGVGLWFSIACRTSLRATLWTLSTVVLAGGGHLGLLMCCLPVNALRQTFGNELAGLQLAITPPMVLYWVANAGMNPNDDLVILISFFTLFLWALAALFLWTITRSRFRRITARMPYRRPELRRRPYAIGPTSPEEDWEEFEVAAVKGGR